MLAWLLPKGVTWQNERFEWSGVTVNELRRHLQGQIYLGSEKSFGSCDSARGDAGQTLLLC